MKRRASILAAILFGIVWLLWPGGKMAFAFHPCNPLTCGELGPLIPFHKDAIHAGLGWTKDKGHWDGWYDEKDKGQKKKRPKICFWMRPSEYQGIHLVDPLLPPGPGALKTTSFQRFVYGRDFDPAPPTEGFTFSRGPHGLDESVATRIQADLYLDNGLCFDLDHPDAFKNPNKFNIADLTVADFDLNRAAFSNAGHSTGLNYNIFCAAQVALANGEWVFVGGHDKAGNNGIRKIPIFNPATQKWVDRGMPPVKAAFLADPEGFLPATHPDPNNEANTDPPHPSDMRYQRWYPTAVHLPNDKVLILSGTDQDSSLADTVGFGQPCPNATASPGCSKYRLNTPEIYVRKHDRTIALENAWKVLSMYPIAYVVQTGPKKKDWKVAVIGEVDHGATGGPFRGDFSDQARGIGISGYDPWPYSGKTYLFDVQAALKDPDRNTPDETGKYWQEVDTTAIAHESGASSMLVKLDKEGRPLSQKLVLFGGGCGQRPMGFPCDRRTVEMFDFQAGTGWVLQDYLEQEASQMQAVALPDGKVLITGGVVGRPGFGPGGWRNSFHYQIFDPYTGTITPLGETNNPWHDHATMLLLPDGSVINMGGNRTDKVYSTGGTCPLGQQCSSQQTRDAGVPVAQVFKPPYFFNGDRPDIKHAPDEISYKERFDIRVSKKSGKIKSVAMIQQHPVTHNHQWNRRVELWFEQKHDGKLEIQAPRFPGVAPPGNYLLFVVDKDGIPSTGELIHLGLDGKDHHGHDDDIGDDDHHGPDHDHHGE
jgi:hypothetical protein